MRAWIETSLVSEVVSKTIVARRVRAWIETTDGGTTWNHATVARRVRAWIETKCDAYKDYGGRSHAVCVRGLKPYVENSFPVCLSRTPCACVD